MKGFFRLVSVDELTKLLDDIPPLGEEEVKLDQALGRVLSKTLIAPEDLPPFNRSTMDGYAVAARDTFGASETEPALLSLSARIPMGSLPEGLVLVRGQAARIWTGGALPPGADAVVMQEYVNEVDGGTIEVFRPVAPLENVIQKGEDVRQGEEVLGSGTVLRPRHLGLLAGLGISRLSVFRRPRVAIISTGDELVPSYAHPRPGQIRDINTTTISSLCEDLGADVIPFGIARDDESELKDFCTRAIEMGADVVIVSGGSSVGRKDYTLGVFQSMEESEVLAHGVAVRPGKPTIIATAKDRLLVGLPGHAASAMVVFHLFVRRILLLLGGRREALELQRTRARLCCNVSSAPGREEYLRVRLFQDGHGKVLAEPVYGKSGLIRPMVEASGLAVIPRDCEGADRGEEIEVLLLP